MTAGGVAAIDGAVVADRLAEVRRRISAAGGDGGRVRIVAVTKGFGPEAVRAALAAGIDDLGESYAQELVAKRAELAGAENASASTSAAPDSGPAPAPAPAPWRWHFLGRVQRNKVRRLAPVVDLWHTVDRPAAGREIARRSPGATVLVQVDATGREGRNGCSPAEAPALVSELRAMELEVAGLMTIGPPGPPEGARPAFRALAELADRLEVAERSMGMSDDLEVAVEEGATMIRVGRALFGPRTVPADRPR